MSVEAALANIPVFILVVFRIAGMMSMAPLFGSAKVPKRVKVLFSLVLAMGMTAGVKAPLHLPDTAWELTAGLAGELAFGLVMGMLVSCVFYAAQWAGEMIGQQMGINVAEVFDPAFGAGSTVVSDMYTMLALIIFMACHGEYFLLGAVRRSFDAMPLLSAGLDRPLFDLFIQLFSAAAMLAVRLAAPMLVTMMVVDLALGVLGKTMPQLNVMTMGLTVRAVVGVLVLALGIGLSGSVIRTFMLDTIDNVQDRWETPAAPQPAAAAMTP